MDYDHPPLCDDSLATETLDSSGHWSEGGVPSADTETGAVTTTTELEDQDMILNDPQDENRIHTPPPHLAARFYRPVNNRRKTSAASSRRNSVSSVHSHQSHASSRARHGGSQSNIVAQHLRRASILEDRKQRLADRAAHAEKVRLRAALAKAAPRGGISSEERAKAAQQAREKNLAEIVASCAEEVKRAKGIARSAREKREAENKKLRKDMEERLAEAEKRREEILSRAHAKRGRSGSAPRKSLSPMREEVAESLSEQDAARRIQKRWVAYRKFKSLKAFGELGLSMEGVQGTSFDDVVSLLAQEKVLLETARVLQNCGLKEGESGSVNEMTAVRTFLSAFLILGHPAQVLSNKADSGEQEQVGSISGALALQNSMANPQLQDLVAKARDLLISFEDVLSRLTIMNNYTPPPAQQVTLSEAYKAFFNAFIAWKARDSSAMIEMMIAQFMELETMWQTVKDSDEEAEVGPYRDGIRDNQLLLMVRIKKLAGPAKGKQLIANAMKQARIKAKAKRLTGDAKPRAADTEASTPPVFGDVAAAEAVITTHLQTLTPPPTPSRDDSTKVEALRRATSMLPDNRTVVHELYINRGYIIKDDALQQRSVLNKAVLDAMRVDVLLGQSDHWILAMAENIRGKLQRLLKEGGALYKAIGESLDAEVVARQLSLGNFSYENFFKFMANLLPRLCAPIRDNDVKALVEYFSDEEDVVSRLERLMSFIDIMQLDYANYMLQQNAVDLIKNSVPYEQKCFSEAIQQGVHGLDVTIQRWTEARARLFSEASKRDPEAIQHPKNRPTSDKIYAEMLTELCTTTGPITPYSIPETLRLDQERIPRLRKEMMQLISAAAIINWSKNHLRQAHTRSWKVVADRIMSVLADESKDTDGLRNGIVTAVQTACSMPAASKDSLREFIRGVICQLKNVDASGEPLPDDQSGTIREPVVRLLLGRFRSHIYTRLTESTSEKVAVQGTTSEKLAGWGFLEFVGMIGDVVGEIERMGRWDRNSHGLWYEEVTKRVEAQVHGEH
jgi:hypothetical protein